MQQVTFTYSRRLHLVIQGGDVQLRSMPLYVQLLKKKEQQTNALQAREGQVSRGAAQQPHVAARTSAVQQKKGACGGTYKRSRDGQ